MLKKLRHVKSCLTQHNDRVVGFENGTISFTYVNYTCWLVFNLIFAVSESVIDSLRYFYL